MSWLINITPYPAVFSAVLISTTCVVGVVVIWLDESTSLTVSGVITVSTTVALFTDGSP